MIFKSSNLAIIIPTSGSKSIYSTYRSILRQNNFPAQIIIVTNRKIKNKFNKKTKVVYSKIKNQVYQRTLALKYLNPNISLLLFLDDKVLLEKNCIKNLILKWNLVSSQTAGIGLSCINYKVPKSTFFHFITGTNSKNKGKVLKNGFVTGYGNLKKDLGVEWLNGGMTSWNLSKVKKSLLNRNFPKISWSVGEDLIFSYNISKKYNLIVSCKSKCKILNNKDSSNFFDSLKKGFLHAYIINSFVDQNPKTLSKLFFYYSILSSSMIGILYGIISFKKNTISKFTGRLLGSFFKFKKIS